MMGSNCCIDLSFKVRTSDGHLSNAWQTQTFSPASPRKDFGPHLIRAECDRSGSFSHQAWSCGPALGFSHGRTQTLALVGSKSRRSKAEEIPSTHFLLFVFPVAPSTIPGTLYTETVFLVMIIKRDPTVLHLEVIHQADEPQSGNFKPNNRPCGQTLG